MNLDEAMDVINHWIMNGRVNTPESETAFAVVQREVNTFRWPSFSSDEVDDVRAEIMLDISKRSSPFKPTKNTRNYLWMIFRNKCIKYYKERKERCESSTTVSDDESEIPQPDDTLRPDRLIPAERVDPHNPNSYQMQSLKLLKQEYSKVRQDAWLEQDLKHIETLYDFEVKKLSTEEIAQNQSEEPLSKQQLKKAVNNINKRRTRIRARLETWFKEYSGKMDADTYEQVKAMLVMMKIIDDA